jgi:hypothetical protein
MDGSDLAHPVKYLFGEEVCIAGGLTKRELIAAMAMQGLLTNAGIVDCYDKIAGLAVNHANALIERLNADPVAEGVDNGK